MCSKFEKVEKIWQMTPSPNEEGTDLQVLETSQGGFHPAARAKCYN